MVSFCLILLFKRISNYPLSTISLMHLGNTQTAKVRKRQLWQLCHAAKKRVLAVPMHYEVPEVLPY